MKTLITLLLTLGGSCSAASAQITPQAPESTKKVVRWLSPDLPKDCCGNYMDNNRLVTVFENERLAYSVIVDVASEKKYVLVSVAIANKSDIPFDVYPNKFVIQMVGGKGKHYNSLEAADVVKKIENQGSWRMAFAAGLSGLATQQATATVQDNRGNSANVIVTEPNHQAQENARLASQEQQRANQIKANAMKMRALPIQTLFKNQSIAGLVFFKKEDLEPGMILSFELDGVIYEIPYGSERTKLNKP